MIVRIFDRDAFGMPASTPFFASGRILGTAHGCKQVIARHANVTTDTFADIFGAVLLDFVGKKRVGNSRTGGADEVEYTSLDLRYHGIWRRKSPYPDHRFTGHRFYKINVRLLVTLFCKTRSHGIVVPVAHINIPQIGQFRENFNDLTAVPRRGDAFVAKQFIDCQPHSHGTGFTDFVPHLFNALTKQSDPVFNTAAILITACIDPWREKL